MDRGYIIKGDLTVTYTNGDAEEARSGEVFYWPPGHTVKVNQDAEFVLFSPNMSIRSFLITSTANLVLESVDRLG